MKQLIQIFTVLAVGMLSMLLATACTDDLIYNDNVSGVPVEVSVGLTVPSPGELDVLKRSGDGKLSLQVYDIMVFAFDSNGNLMQRYYFHDISEDETKCDPDWSIDGTAVLKMDMSTGIATLSKMTVLSGTGYLMGVANVEIKSTILLNKLKEIKNRSELIALTASDSHYDSDVSIMGGAYTENNSISGEVSEYGKVFFQSGKLKGAIRFLSTASAVKVNITSKGVKDRDWGIFTLESFELVNLPKQTPLFMLSDNITTPEYGATITTGEIEVFEESKPNEYSFDYQTLEYLRKSEKPIYKYSDRAAWDPQATGENAYKIFTNAPSDAPYMIIRGTYLGKSEYMDEDGDYSSGNVSANVSYYIFLGHDSGNGNSEGWQDFSTHRNWEYTYNITINGVKEITVEVNKKDESSSFREDADGDVIVMDSKGSHRFDSHYCQTEFTMTVGEIRELVDNRLLAFRVQAPAYGIDTELSLWDSSKNGYVNENTNLGVYDEQGNRIGGSNDLSRIKGYMDLNDKACVAADWLRFYRNTEAELLKDEWLINYSDVLKSGQQGKQSFLTIYQFLCDLKALAEDKSLADSKKVRYTVFVQENYYEDNWNDRKIMEYATRNKAPEIHWSQFVNVDDRKVMLFPDTKRSEDGASSFSNPKRVFSQRSIRTIYKPINEKGYKAWGTESKEEFFHSYVSGSNYPAWFKDLGGIGTNWTQVRKMLAIKKHSDGKKIVLPKVSNMGYTLSDHGREASYNEMKGGSWTKYIKYTNKPKNYEEGDPYDLNYRLSGNVEINENGTTTPNMISACLARNRDLNGDGIIDADEIRWYVPGIRQLQALFVGNAGLPLEARLYQKEANAGKWIYKHYMSATRHLDEKGNVDTSNAILWAEEGISTGLMEKSYAYGVNVRCVRDLGTNLKDKADTWSDSFKILKTASGVAGGYIDIDKFNDNSVRYALENKDLSGVVTTFSNSNRPARSFYYANKIINNGYYKDIVDHTVVADWTSNKLVRIGVENLKSESSPQKRSLCGQTFGQGWRTPTITELAILYWSGVFKREDNLVSRTRYVFWNIDGKIKYGSDIITGEHNDQYGRDPHSFCESEFRLRIHWNNVKPPTDKQANHAAQINGHWGGILCVKDKL